MFGMKNYMYLKFIFCLFFIYIYIGVDDEYFDLDDDFFKVVGMARYFLYI